jgi:shikimate dehydrogenase
LLGDPVAQSLSPLMQNAAFAARGLDWAYVPLLVAAERLAAGLEGLVALDFAGANVTTPHKLTVAKLVETDEPSFATVASSALRRTRPSSESSTFGEP